MHSRLSGSRGDGVEGKLQQRAGEGWLRHDSDDATPARHIGRLQSRPNGRVRTRSPRSCKKPEESCGLGTPAASDLNCEFRSDPSATLLADPGFSTLKWDGVRGVEGKGTGGRTSCAVVAERVKQTTARQAQGGGASGGAKRRAAQEELSELYKSAGWRCELGSALHWIGWRAPRALVSRCENRRVA